MEKVADFAITQCDFNPNGTYLACSSVANSISLIKLDQGLEKRVGSMRQSVMSLLILILAFIILVLAIRMYSRRS